MRTKHNKIEEGLESWRQLSEFDARLYEAKGIRILTPEARILIFLRLSGPVSVAEAMAAAGTSSRGFYDVIDRLKSAGLVAQEKDTDDQRVRRLSLDPTGPSPGLPFASELARANQ